MIVTRSGRAINNEAGTTPQNVGARFAQLPMDEVRLMMQKMLDQQRHPFIEILTQGLDSGC